MYFTSFVITRTSLYRGSLHRGSIVEFSKVLFARHSVRVFRGLTVRGSLNLLLRNRSTSSVVSFFREPYHIRLQFVISPLGTNIIFVVTISGSVDTLLYH